MKTYFLKISVATISALLINSFAISSFAISRDINLSFKNRSFSAKLQDAILGDLLDILKKNTGIWYNGDESTLLRPVSCQFENLSLERGIKILLSSINYALIYDANGEVVGITIFGIKEKNDAKTEEFAVDYREAPQERANLAPYIGKESTISDYE